jgi:hypothetical protein
MARSRRKIQVTVESEKIWRQLPSVHIHAINPTIHAEKTTIEQPRVEFKTHLVDPILDLRRGPIIRALNLTRPIATKTAS